MASRLSAELLFNTVSHVLKAALQSDRLLSKAFCALASDTLFRCVSVSVHLRDLTTFYAIAQSPILDSLVQSLIYIAKYFISAGLREQECIWFLRL